MISSQVIALCVALKNQGLTWPQVAEEVTKAGFVDHNGKPYHNAALASTVVKFHPSLRQRAVRPVKKAKTSRRKVTRKSSKSKRSSSISTTISAMQKANVPASLILETLKNLK